MVAERRKFEGLSDTWLDRYFEPRDINTMNYDDILSLPNISPIDANAVLLQKKEVASMEHLS